MNEKMINIFIEDIVTSLPWNRRKLYQFIVSIEDCLAKQSETKEQFLELLREHSPHHQAAKQFNISIETTLRVMQDIEDEISEKLEKRLNNYKWIDVTEHINGTQISTNQNIQYFFITS
ncbi:hypothetical protein [Litchfieldia alkalitelluris]|uniref:hypothetical protein n=1 Tax=Litchfieldia alkalitelluris TaxID=304268 RepID=UPI000997AC2D|nr:hypothetical protein [Litchfieldia alkalitelluris]